jgi:hypothetical protein
MIEHAKTYNNHAFNLVEKSNVNNVNKIEINHYQPNNVISEKTSTNNINHINSNVTNNISSERTNILSPKENFQETQDDTFPQNDKNLSNIEKVERVESPKKKPKVNLADLQEKKKLNEVNLNENKFVVIKKEEVKKKKLRTDHYGNEIKHQNRHIIKVTFADEIYNRPLEEVVNIQSIKEFNIVYGMPKERDVFGKNKNVCCGCVIF